MKKLTLILTLPLLLILGACSGANYNGFNPENDSNVGGNSNQVIEDLPPAVPPAAPQIQFSAKMQSSLLFGESKTITKFRNEDKVLEVHLPFPLSSLGVSLSGTLPQNPNVSFYTSQDLSSLVLEIPIAAYVNLLQNPNQLPGGRPLPGVSGGEPPVLALELAQLSNKKVYGYMGVDYLAFFLESGANLPINFQTNIATETEIVGTAGWLAPRGSYKGGVFVSLRLPRELAVLIANSQ